MIRRAAKLGSSEKPLDEITSSISKALVVLVHDQLLLCNVKESAASVGNSSHGTRTGVDSMDGISEGFPAVKGFPATDLDE